MSCQFDTRTSELCHNLETVYAQRLPIDAPLQEPSLSRLARHEAGDMTEFCFWCGRPYVGTGDFPYCSWTCRQGSYTKTDL